MFNVVELKFGTVELMFSTVELKFNDAEHKHILRRNIIIFGLPNNLTRDNKQYNQEGG